MRRIVLLCVLFLAGCLNVSGPFAPKSKVRVDDPRLSINEQEARIRDRWALQDPNLKIGADAVDQRLTPPYR